MTTDDVKAWVALAMDVPEVREAMREALSVPVVDPAPSRRESWAKQRRCVYRYPGTDKWQVRKQVGGVRLYIALPSGELCDAILADIEQSIDNHRRENNVLTRKARSYPERER